MSKIEARLIGRSPGAEWWAGAGEVYRVSCSERDPVQMDIYGLPMGRRWECSEEHFLRSREIYSWIEEPRGGG